MVSSSEHEAEEQVNSLTMSASLQRSDQATCSTIGSLGLSALDLGHDGEDQPVFHARAQHLTSSSGCRTRSTDEDFSVPVEAALEVVLDGRLKMMGRTAPGCNGENYVPCQDALRPSSPQDCMVRAVLQEPPVSPSSVVASPSSRAASTELDTDSSASPEGKLTPPHQDSRKSLPTCRKRAMPSTRMTKSVPSSGVTGDVRPPACPVVDLESEASTRCKRSRQA
eukprot:TRINITY_DN51355_c0_g1_i1.p1 TRINITY_DN51355_c0_g1~~TRINITY_DN51355_c0_g1_i1.p1  ORF type:complete len:224 (-),score=31.78 TRINITY_DN51355_c0_g1_i1:30-701(-)